MNEQRLEAYLQLINQLLTSPSGQEAEILQANHELIDADFLQVAELLAQDLEAKGQTNVQLSCRI